MSGSRTATVCSRTTGSMTISRSSAALAHDLPVDLAFGRHVDDEVAADPRLAAEPPAGRKGAALLDVALLDRAPRAGVSRARIQRVLGEGALGDVDLAAAADPAPAADGIEIDPEFSGGVEQARPVGERAALAGRGEDDPVFAHDGLAASAPARARRVEERRDPAEAGEAALIGEAQAVGGGAGARVVSGSSTCARCTTRR